jgi:arylamine N-acetyltransferase
MGYDAMLCGADMQNPDVHLVNMVTVDGTEFMVDAGYAAPFLEPLPRDLTHDLEIPLGRDRYVLRPKDDRGYSRVDLYRDGELIHGYTAKPIARTIDFFAAEIERSFSSEATFMNSLLAVRQYPNRSTVIYNMTVIESVGEEYTIISLEDRSEIPERVEEHLAIPGTIVSDAVSQLGEFGNAWS